MLKSRGFMKMPVCQNCGERWTWNQTFKRMFTLATSMRCPYCEKKQYLTTKSRRRSSFCGFVPPLTLLLPIIFDASSLTTIIILIGTSLLMIGIWPFFIELSNQEEPLW
ncbi:TIGR04104 family putative zinc finger protein [Caldalkalibacillus thermarum]|uniref:TIGR04104 family putative zinc finger protein n=1 Tax=Caldalkalibacillus thermarum TaxID=296745 RepID=UPI0030845424